MISKTSLSAYHVDDVKKLQQISIKILIWSLRYFLFSKYFVTLNVSPYLVL